MPEKEEIKGGKEVIAIVNGVEITKDEFIQRLMPTIGKGILEYMITEIIIEQKAKEQNLGDFYLLPAHGRGGTKATPLAALFAKRKTKFGGGGKALLRLSATDGQARAGKNSFPPTPFFFARPSENYQKSASGFSLKKVRILFRTDSIF